MSLLKLFNDSDDDDDGGCCNNDDPVETSLQTALKDCSRLPAIRCFLATSKDSISRIRWSVSFNVENSCDMTATRVSLDQKPIAICFLISDTYIPRSLQSLTLSKKYSQVFSPRRWLRCSIDFHFSAMDFSLRNVPLNSERKVFQSLIESVRLKYQLRAAFFKWAPAVSKATVSVQQCRVAVYSNCLSQTLASTATSSPVKSPMLCDNFPIEEPKLDFFLRHSNHLPAELMLSPPPFHNQWSFFSFFI